MVMIGEFRCIAINKFTEKPRFIHDKKKCIQCIRKKSKTKTTQTFAIFDLKGVLGSSYVLNRLSKMTALRAGF